MAERKIELADETAGAEGEQLLAQSDDLFFDGGGSFAGLMMRGVGDFDQSTPSLLLIAAQPLAYGGDGGLKQRAVGLIPRCRADCTSRKRWL